MYKNKRDPFIKDRIKSLGYAIKGAYLLFKRESSIKLQVSITILMTIAGFYYNLSTIEWCIQIILVALIIAIEGINTAIEEIADFIHPEYHKKIGLIKDIAAGSVLIAAVAALIIGCLIYFPKIF